MNEKLTYTEVAIKFMLSRDTKLILDSGVAALYEVEPKRVKEALKNNLDRFPEGYIISLNDIEIEDLRSKFSTTNLTKSRVNPKAITEKWHYMLDTILENTKVIPNIQFPL